MDSYPILRWLLNAFITDESTPTSFTAVIRPAPIRPPNLLQKLTLIVLPRKLLPPPRQFLATKRPKLNTEVFFETHHRYNELLKSHEDYLDSLLLATSFQNLFVTSSTS